jgi:hypothetical protein
MTERDIRKLQNDATDLSAMVSIVSFASDLAAMGQKLLTMSNQITEALGTIAERNGYTVEELCDPLRI